MGQHVDTPQNGSSLGLTAYVLDAPAAGYASAAFAPRTRLPVTFNQRTMDKIAIALHQACDLADVDVAIRLVQIMDKLVAERLLKGGGTRRRAVETLVEAHEHVWQLRFGGDGAEERPEVAAPGAVAT